MKGRSALSLALIVAGCLCVAVPFAVEAVNYPWGSSNETELPDPPPPEIEFISYADYIIETLPEEPGAPQASEKPAVNREVLPGHDEGDGAPESAETPEGPKPAAPSLPKYVLLGTVKIPRVNLSENLFMGAEGPLRHGIGHLEETPMPGEKGNAVIAAHRVSSGGKQPFRHLDKMREGDTVSVKMDDKIFSYEVFDTFIVSEHDLWVLGPVAGETHVLTLVTCDPVVSAGRRENRLIVRARLTGG